ncbi:MAG: STAS domain-containing protein [Spirochaetota bacterium]|nr:STAS domain-containing protein [Spirochaetota bacterium]
MEKNNNIITFPLNISFEMVSSYLKRFERESHNSSIIFDLSKTETIHSSFIGFLIHAKQKTEKGGGKLTIIISPSMERIFIMLNIIEYLTCVSSKNLYSIV